MKVPLSWIKDFVKITLSPEEIARKLTFAGLEVEEIEYIGAAMPNNAAHDMHSSAKQEFKVSGFSWDREKIVVAQILEVMPHPNADRLTLLRLDWGGAKEETVLTGAPNIFDLKGTGALAKPIKVAYAKEGATLYDGHQEGQVLMTLKRAKIRGVESYSMVCSEKELGISEEHEGIIILDDDAPVGMSLADTIGDVIFTVKINPNMARNANVYGVAREIAALTNQKLKAMPLDVIQNGATLKGRLNIEIKESELNPRFTAMLIRDVKIAPSPYWMQRRLRLAGMRPINNIVDITNYVMLETGQPLHAFDYDVLVKRANGKTPTIITRLPKKDERLLTLDNMDRKLDPFTILVTDTAGALSIGGVMGGGESEVSKESKNILLEAAAWNFINIRRTVKAQSLESSQAGYRFSRGVHPAMAERGCKRAAEMMRTLARGVVAKGFVDVYPRKPKTIKVDIGEADVKRLLGIRIPLTRIVKILESLEFMCEPIRNKREAEVRVTVPDHRMDVGEGVIGQADLIEDIARVYGYENIPETQITDTTPPQRTNTELEVENRAKDILVSVGLQEIVSYRLTTPEREAMLKMKDDRGYVTLQNPIASDRTVMRHSVLSSVFESVASNVRFTDRVAIFEAGKVYMPHEKNPLPDEPRRIAIALTGPRDPEGWQKADRSAMDFYDLKGVVMALADGLHLPNVSVSPIEHPTFRPGRTAQLLINGDAVGVFGEVHPLVSQSFLKAGGYTGEAASLLAADLDLEMITARVPFGHPSLSISRFPPVVEDIALIVDESVAAAQVQALILESGGAVLASVNLFDLYRGDQIGSGKKSLAYRLTYQLEDRTLTDTDVAKVREKIVKRARDMVGAVLRG